MLKLFSIAIVLIMINESTSSEEDNCIQDDDGDCLETCPPGTKAYNPTCEEEGLSQRTCREPDARPIRVVCDYSRCDCPEPLVWDEAAEKCVLHENCSQQ